MGMFWLCLAVPLVLSDTGGTLSPVVAGPHHNESDLLPEEGEPSVPLTFVSPMKNYTKFSGENLKLRCEVTGHPPVAEFRWFKNEAPLVEEKGRVRIRSRVGSGDTQLSRVIFRTLETMDTGFYRCEASNGEAVANAESLVKVHRSGSGGWGKKSKDQKPDWDDDYENDGSDHFGKKSKFKILLKTNYWYFQRHEMLTLVHQLIILFFKSFNVHYIIDRYSWTKHCSDA